MEMILSFIKKSMRNVLKIMKNLCCLIKGLEILKETGTCLKSLLMSKEKDESVSYLFIMKKCLFIEIKRILKNKLKKYGLEFLI